MPLLLRAVTGLVVCGSLAFLGYGGTLLIARGPEDAPRALALAIVGLSAGGLTAGIVGFVYSFRRQR
jgi:hypothetical protein